MDNGLIRADSLKIQLQRSLRDRIRNGVYSPGSQFPSEGELVDAYAVSRTTVRTALAALEAEGLINRKWGVGTFVADRLYIAHQIEEALDFMEIIASAGYKPGVHVIGAKATIVTSLEAERLDAEEGGELLRVTKVFLADGDPVIYAVNLIPHRILGDRLFNEVQRRPELTEPVYTFFDETCGHRVDYHIATLAAILARDSEIPIPGIAPITPLLTMSSVGHDREGRPVFESRSTYPDPRIQMKLFRRRT